MKTLFIDCFSGISGDKFVASLLGITNDFDYLIKQLKTLPISDEFELQLEEVLLSGIHSLQFHVHCQDHHHHKHQHSHDHHHRGLSAIIEIIDSSKISANAKKFAKDIFQILGEAEARAHHVPIEEIHFHEVGAVDSIVDIVASAVLIDQIQPDNIICSPVAVGAGFVNTQHGRLPVPAPATAEILTGCPTYASEIKSELTTPTGAAIVKYFVSEFKDMPQFTAEKIGYGAGTKRFDIPNFLRVFLGKIFSKHNDEIIIAETNLDDCTPEQLSYLAEKLFAVGAVDVFTAPIVMKKGRQGSWLNVQFKAKDQQKIEETIFSNTSTFGIRFKKQERTILERKYITMKIDDEEIIVKKGYYQGKEISSKLEYEKVKAFCEKKKISYNEALRMIQKKIIK
ncbi:MAG: nickel pincer cofactor biosynthesis protein LarC [Spirochaetes bacterium]|nr:nickel pincer cofactor biosynthesis protein LarC [Spirochaetota bacterium]